ncbi:MAG: type II secretion system protein GspD [Planctomycetota bacterium]|jgi:hypothetical protein
MNRPKYSRTAIAFAFFGPCLWWGIWQSEAVRAQGPLAIGVGRENPFGDIARPKPKKPVARPILNPWQPEAEAPDLYFDTVTLKFLDAEKLKDVVEKMCTEYGGVEANPRTNSLMICDTQENLARIISEIKKADKTPRQIMIEVVIADVQVGDDTEIGVNWDLMSHENYDVGYRQNFTASRLRSTIENTSTIGDATAFVTRGFGGDFSVISGTVRNVLHLLQQKREAEILASPRVMVVSGEIASIEAVEELPYTEVKDTAGAGIGALTSTEFKSVGVQLHVGATITDVNNIYLTVEAIQNVATGESDTEIPIVDTRKAKTSLLLQDGEIVIMGGLRRQEKIKVVEQIPILGDIPLIGLLFKSTNTLVKSSELVVFLAPHIYDGEPVGQEEMEKFNEITDKPMLSLPEQEQDKSSEQDRDLERRIEEQATATLQLQEEIAGLMLAEDEWEEHRKELEQRLEEQALAGEQLELEISERRAAEDQWHAYRIELERRVWDQAVTNERLEGQIAELVTEQEQWESYRAQFAARLEEQSAANEQLQQELAERRRAEQEWQQYREQLEQRLDREGAAGEQSQQEVSELRSQGRSISKKVLLEKIKTLRSRRTDKAAADELLSTIAELQKIIGQEIQECLSATEEAEAEEDT